MAVGEEAIAVSTVKGSFPPVSTLTATFNINGKTHTTVSESYTATDDQREASFDSTCLSFHRRRRLRTLICQLRYLTCDSAHIIHFAARLSFSDGPSQYINDLPLCYVRALRLVVFSNSPQYINIHEIYKVCL